MPDQRGRSLLDLRADLHSHSVHSDGTLSPRALVERAAARGVELYSLTDHDETCGLADAEAAARELDLPWVPGVEISVSWGNTTVHVVGLGIDAACAELQRGLAEVRAGRDQRAREMAAGLNAVGVQHSYEGAIALASNPAMVSRTHFARFLVLTGVCHDVRDVFQRFLVAGKPGYVPHQWANLADAVQWISTAGGVAVMAHPGRYRIGALALHELLTEFRTAGGVALEVATSSHTEADIARFGRIAQEFGFEVSRGSDFHAPDEADKVELGMALTLPPGLTPVWHRFVDARVKAL